MGNESRRRKIRKDGRGLKGEGPEPSKGQAWSEVPTTRFGVPAWAGFLAGDLCTNQKPMGFFGGLAMCQWCFR